MSLNGSREFEVTAGEYAAFLKAVAKTDTYGLYNAYMWGAHPHGDYGCKIQRSGSAGNYGYTVASDWANRPVNFVSWGDAARFCNWLTNGQPAGAQGLATTEDGSYYLNGAMTDAEPLAVTRKSSARYVIPSDAEWYKVAFHKNDGPTNHYWLYPTSTDAAPSNDLINPDPGNNANFHDGLYTDPSAFTIGSPYYRTQVGEFENSESPYGTFDQEGNVIEWTEEIKVFGPNTERGLRGGSFYSYSLRKTQGAAQHPSLDQYEIGFRIAYVPEPAMLGLLGLGALATIWRREH